MSAAVDTAQEWDVPLVQGQERSSARARARAICSVQLALQGWSYQAIADELGYANRGTVHRIVRNTLAEHEVESIEVLLALELARLDRLFAAFFDDAINGDVKSAEVCLKISIQRSKLLRLDLPRPQLESSHVVVTGTREEFIGALREGQRGAP